MVLHCIILCRALFWEGVLDGVHYLESLVLCVQVDKYIRKLDAELSRFEHELQLKDPSVGRASLSSISDMQSSGLTSKPIHTLLCAYTHTHT